MNTESFQKFCLSFPYATEDIKWKSDLCFSIGGKMFAVVTLEPSEIALTFKCTPEKYVELIERENIIPAPYVARYQWVAVKTFQAITEEELKELVTNSYHLVYEKLSKKAKLNFQ